jgi:hypothetical protein
MQGGRISDFVAFGALGPTTKRTPAHPRYCSRP